MYVKIRAFWMILAEKEVVYFFDEFFMVDYLNKCLRRMNKRVVRHHSHENLNLRTMRTLKCTEITLNNTNKILLSLTLTSI